MRVGIAVTCAVCRRRKKPVGRSAADEMANSLCDHECEGYQREPFVGSLWPGESEEDFGYPVGMHGTIDAGQPQPTPAPVSDAQGRNED